MEQNQAIEVLIQAVQIGQKAGAYSFEDSALILQAIKTFKPNAGTEDVAEEAEEANSTKTAKAVKSKK